MLNQTSYLIVFAAEMDKIDRKKLHQMKKYSGI